MNFHPVPGELLEYGLGLMGFGSICLKLFAPNMHKSNDSAKLAPLAKMIGKPISTEIDNLDDAISQCQDIVNQFREVSMGRQQLNLVYIGDCYVIKFWKLAFWIYTTSDRIPMMEIGGLVETLGHEIANALIDAAKKEML